MRQADLGLNALFIDLHFNKGWSYGRIALRYDASRNSVAGRIRRNRGKRISPNKHKQGMVKNG